MKNFYNILLITTAFVLGVCLFSCRNDGNNAVPKQALIVGKWNLQKQQVVLLIDGVKIVDTVYTANAATNTFAYAVFNNDGTDSTRSAYNPGGTLSLSSPAPYYASSKGAYSITNSTFNGAFGTSGWFSYAVGTSGPITLTNDECKITLLNTSNLNLQEQVAFTYTNNGTHTYQETSDYYYTK